MMYTVGTSGQVFGVVAISHMRYARVLLRETTHEERRERCHVSTVWLTSILRPICSLENG